MKFHYKARDKNKKDLEGEREASDRFALAREIRAEGLMLISAQPIGDSVSMVGRLLKYIFNFSRVKMKDKIVFASNLSTMVSAGLSLSRALTVIERQSSSKVFQRLIAAISDDVRKGRSLSSALTEFPNTFPPVFVAMVNAGEESGQLPQALNIVAEQLTKSYDLRRRVRGAMIYPSIIVVVIILIGILMMIFLVPNLTAIFEEMNAELPLSTRIVIGISDFLSQLGSHALFSPRPVVFKPVRQVIVHIIILRVSSLQGFG